MDKDATIARVGHGATPGTTRVRYAAAQASSGGCPFLTAFVQMKDEASKKVEEIKRDLGEKWDEVTGKKS